MLNHARERWETGDIQADPTCPEDRRTGRPDDIHLLGRPSAGEAAGRSSSCKHGSVRAQLTWCSMGCMTLVVLNIYKHVSSC